MTECAPQRPSPVRLGNMGVGSVSHHRSPMTTLSQTLPVIQINSKPQNDSPAALLPVEQLLSSVAAAAAAAAANTSNNSAENSGVSPNREQQHQHLNGHHSNGRNNHLQAPIVYGITEDLEDDSLERRHGLQNTRHVSASLDSVVARTNDLRLSPIAGITTSGILQTSTSPLLSSSSSSSQLYPLPSQQSCSPSSGFQYPFRTLLPFGTVPGPGGHYLSPDCDVRGTFHASNSSLSSNSSLGSCAGVSQSFVLNDYNNNLNHNPYLLNLGRTVSSSSSSSSSAASETVTKTVSTNSGSVTCIQPNIAPANMSGVGVATHPLSPLVSNSTNAPSNAPTSIASCSTAPGQGQSPGSGLSLVMSSSTASGSLTSQGSAFTTAVSSSIAPGIGQPIPLQTSGSGDSVGSSPGSVPPNDQFRAQFMQLKHQQQIQQQLLLQQFQVQQAQLNEHHEKQMQEHIREYLEQKQRLEEEQARLIARQEAATLAMSKLQRNHSSTNILASGSSPPGCSSGSAQLSSAKKSKPTGNGNNNGSACASQEVKQKLAEFVLAKRQREAAAAAAAAAAASGTVPAGQGGVPLPISKVAPWLGKYDNDFPLRKTASEPNLKVRSALKAKVIQRRSSPLLKRKDKPSPLKRRTMSNDTANGIPENSSSPPSTNGVGGTGVLSHQSSFHSSSGSTPIQEVQSPSPFGSSGLGQSVSSSCAGSSVATGPLNASCDLEQLYSSPSLPNISLGRPHHPIPLAKSHHEKQLFNAVQQATVQFNDLQMRAALARSVAVASAASGTVSGTQNASAQGPSSASTSGFFPSLPVIEGDFTPPISPSFGQQAGIAGQVHQTGALPAFTTPAMAAAGGFTAAALANSAALLSYATAAAAVGIPLSLPSGDQITTQASINGTTTTITSGTPQASGAERIRPTAALHAARLVQRPLGRTQSAPLPLGHPALLQTNAGSTTTVSSSGSASTTSSTGTTNNGGASSLVKQQIRAAVLQRTSSKSQMAVADVEEETEAAVAAEEADVKMDNSELDDQVMDLTSKSTSHTGRHSSIGSSGSCPTPPQQHFFGVQNQHANYPLATSATIDLSSIPFYHRHHLTGSSGSLHQTPTPSHLSSLEAATSALSGPFESSIAAAIYQRQLLAAAVAATQNAATPFRSPFPAGGLHGPLFGHHFGSHVHPGRPLSRTLSSPQVMLSHSNNSPGSKSPDVGSLFPVSTGPAAAAPLRFTTALVYDSFMQKHQCSCADAFQHPEHGGRLQSIWARLMETGLVARCERIRSRKATLEEIQQCHSEAYTLLFGSSPHNRHKIDPVKLANLPIKSFVMLPCGGIGVDSDTTWNELHSAGAARMAAGCVTELALKVANKEVKNGFAIVRPPGSHAEHQQAMGFCFFNSVAIAVKQLKAKTSLKRILIVDWDVHHGNGLQQMFYDDPHVLYISLHRHDEGNFFPGTGDVSEIGSGPGAGFNVNIAWTGALNPPLGDAEYLAAFRSIVMPIARQFDPEIVMVACGFDAAVGHAAPLGGYCVSPACFGWMTQQLLTLAEGRLVMALEGGYELAAICDSAQICVSALLGDPIPSIKDEEISKKPADIAIALLNRVIQIQSPQWSNVRRYANLIACDALEAQQKEREEFETLNAMASLTMKHVQSPESEMTEEPMEEDK